MALNLVKLCVGVASIEELEHWQAERLAELARRGAQPRIVHATFQTPKRQTELLSGGSLYWIVKGFIQVRQRLIGLEEGVKEDGTPACSLVLDPRLVPVRPVPRRPFQGWRYLAAGDVPADLGAGENCQIGEMPAKMRRELAELFLI